MPKFHLLQPRISEKSYRLTQSGNVYVFDVPVNVNKNEIKEMVEKHFKVAVVSVNTQIKKGKEKASVRRRVQPQKGRQATVKRAYVKLKQGDKIPIFEEV